MRTSRSSSLLPLAAVLSLLVPVQATNLPVDPTLGAGKVLVRFFPGGDARWLAGVYYYPPRGRPAEYTVQGSVAGVPVSGRGLATAPARITVVSVDEFAPELSRYLEPVRVSETVTRDRRDPRTHHVTLTLANGSEHPTMIRVTYLNWTHLDFGERTLDQHVTARLEDRDLELQPFTLRRSRFVRADLLWTDAGRYRFPYVRLEPHATLTLHLDVTADRSPGKLLVTRRVLLSNPPVPVTLQVEVRRPASYRLSGRRVSFWVPAPGVRYEVEYLIKDGDRLKLERLEGASEAQGVRTVELPVEPELVSVHLRQPARIAFEVRDRLRVSLKRPSDHREGVRVSWRIEDGRARIALSGRGRVLVGLILDGTRAAGLRVDGGSVLETGTLPSGRAYAIVDAGVVERERVIVVEGPRVLSVLARAVGRPEAPTVQ